MHNVAAEKCCERKKKKEKPCTYLDASAVEYSGLRVAQDGAEERGHKDAQRPQQKEVVRGRPWSGHARTSLHGDVKMSSILNVSAYSLWCTSLHALSSSALVRMRERGRDSSCFAESRHGHNRERTTVSDKKTHRHPASHNPVPHTHPPVSLHCLTSCSASLLPSRAADSSTPIMRVLNQNWNSLVVSNMPPQ